MCLLGSINNGLGETFSALTEEQPVNAVYVSYVAHERTGRIIVFFSEDSGFQCFFWEDGFIAWRKSKSKKFFTAQLELKQIKELIRKIQDSFEQGAKRLGGVRISNPRAIAYHGNNVVLQIATDDFLQSGVWCENSVNYYEKHGAKSLEVSINNYKQIREFGILPIVEQCYFPINKKLEELTQEDISLMTRKFKEDIDHLLFCKQMILSLLPADQDPAKAVEIRLKDTKSKIALRYGSRISEYRFVYTDEDANLSLGREGTGFMANLSVFFHRMFTMQKTENSQVPLEQEKGEQEKGVCPEFVENGRETPQK